MRKPVFGRRRSRPALQGRPLQSVIIKRYTEYEPVPWVGVPALRAGRFRVDEREVGGDAPKDFVWIYECRPGGCRPADWHKWPAYIAKVGHQFYPAESITEQLITRIGQECGLKIADSRLMICAGQIRFLSRYFLQPGEILNHGAEILVGYLADKGFVEGVTSEKAEKDLFTFQVFCTAMKVRFPAHHEQLTKDFVRLIGFDALVGNQDRHFYNWGVITNATGPLTPRFAPIYDTARGLFWNTIESGLVKFDQLQALEAYVRRSRPQIGWDGWDESRGELGHFDLIGSIGAHDVRYWKWLEQLGKTALATLGSIEGMIDAEFGNLLSVHRRELIKRCLRLRFETFAKVF
jgi:HipA-like C-terminal domain